MHKISIVILTYNNEETIDSLLSSLVVLKSEFEVIVVDNNSTDKTLAEVKKYNFVDLIENKKNLGFSAGNNVGIRYALQKGADVVFLFNPDTIVPKDFLKNFNKSTKLLFDKESVGIVGPKIYDEKGKIWSIGGKLDKKRYSTYLVGYGKDDQHSRGLTSNINYVSGTGVFIKRGVFEKIGFLKEDYFLYYEDVDFCLRAIKAGFRLVVDKNISIIHKASSSVGENSPIMQYYMARNHMLFVERFASILIRLREIIRLPKTLYQARKKKYELIGIRDYFLRRFNKYDYRS